MARPLIAVRDPYVSPRSWLRPTLHREESFWQGKVFRGPTHDLVNLLTPFGRQAIKAEVRLDESLFDGRPCILLDYSTSSRVARDVRDEIRQIGEHQYLGLVYRKGRKLGVYFVLTFVPVVRADAL